MSAKFEDLEKEIKKKNEKVNQLEKIIQSLVKQHGVDESNDENTNEILVKPFSEELVGVEVKEDDPHRSHRLGKPKIKDNKPRPIIVKFARYAVRTEIFMNKTKLKGKRMLVTESLTSSQMQLKKNMG